MKKIFFIAALLFTTAFAFTACSDNNKESKTEQLVKDEMYTCSMHNEVMSTQTGKCPKCGMKLTKQRMTDDQMKMMKEGSYTKPKE